MAELVQYRSASTRENIVPLSPPVVASSRLYDLNCIKLFAFCHFAWFAISPSSPPETLVCNTTFWVKTFILACENQFLQRIALEKVGKRVRKGRKGWTHHEELNPVYSR